MANVLPGKYNNLEMKVKVFSVTFCWSCLCGWILALLFQVVKVYCLSVLTLTNPHIILTLSRVSETPTILPLISRTRNEWFSGCWNYLSSFHIFQCISSLMFIFTKLFLFSSSMSFCILIWFLVSWCMVNFFYSWTWKPNNQSCVFVFYGTRSWSFCISLHFKAAHVQYISFKLYVIDLLITNQNLFH